MKCPSCKTGTIQIDNSVNDMSPYCDNCNAYFDQNYLDGYCDAMKDLQVVTCIYCGKAYPPGTPKHGEKVSALTDHIKVCEKHPLREAEEKIKKLRSALIGLVEAESREELEEMELTFRTTSLPIPKQDKINSINAIRVLIETIEEDG